MTDTREGQVVTFYSYKGGTGRTMALANVAWILAANGKRVLVVDWDLESPGLDRFYAPLIEPDMLADNGGVISLIRKFEWATTQRVDKADADPVPPPKDWPAEWFEEYARVQTHAFSLNWRFPTGGTLDFLPAGRQNRDYVPTLSGMNWDHFYEKRGGGKFFDALRADMKRHYDYTLIDSRTGLSDVADICTTHLPDVLVACFTLSAQGMDGAAEVAQAVHRRYPHIRVLPALMRVDPAEKEKAEIGRLVARQRFAGLPADLGEAEWESYWTRMHVPYQAFYAYEESLATFGDTPGAGGTLLSAYEALTGYISGGEVTLLPPMPEAQRSRVNEQFRRRLSMTENAVALRYAPEDQVWAEWIEHVLTSAGVRVSNPWSDSSGDEVLGLHLARQLLLVSQTNAASEATMVPDHGSGGQPTPLAVYLADLPALPNIPLADSTFIGGLSRDNAVERLLDLVGLPGSAASSITAGPRYPGEEPRIFNVPARNTKFTGREEDLRELRAQLRRGGAVVLSGVQPVALQGMGGIGKTQVAMEYAHRFRSAYDVIWWIGSDPVTFVDASLLELGAQLGIPMQASGPENTRAVLTALSQGRPHPRWLLIFDNAEDPERVASLLPRGGGHVMITSRNPSWGDRAQMLQVDVFRRGESVSHLVQRVPTMRREEADRIAEQLGDLPIAVAAAGAWLAETGTGPDEYLRQIATTGPGALQVEPVSGRSVEATWDLSLHRLRERSPAAYRLLQLCSFLAPEIPLELIYSDEMAGLLARLDPAVSERLVRGSLVQQINRLALLRVDQRAAERGQGGQIIVHRLLQHVVRSRMTEEEQAEARRQVHRVLAGARPSGEVDDPNTWSSFRALWPHVEFTGAAHSRDESVRALLIDRVRYLWLRGDLATGDKLAGDVDEIWSDQLQSTGGDEARTLRTQLLHLRFLHANILRSLGEFQSSRDLDERVLDEQRTLLGAEHPHALMTRGGLAADMRGLGRYRAALDLDLDTYSLWLDQMGDDHPRTLTALSNLAVSFRLMGEFRDALERDDTVYERRRGVLSETHPDTLKSAGSAGRDLREAGEYERSASLLEGVFRTVIDVLGPESRDAWNAQANLAVSLRSLGRAGDASAHLEHAYERLNDLLGPANPDTLACRLSRAVNLLALGDVSTAERELVAVRSAYKDSLGEAHPHTLVCANNLAEVARAMNQAERAQQLAREAADGLREALGTDHPYTLAAQMNYAIATAEVGDNSSAQAVLADVAPRLEDKLGKSHPDALRCRANLALIRARLEQPGAPVEVATALDLLAATIGRDHPAVRALGDGLLLRRVIDPHPF